MKAREVRDRLKGRVDPEVSRVMEELAEKQSHLLGRVTEMAMTLAKMAEFLETITSANAEVMKRIEAIRKNMPSDSDTIDPKTGVVVNSEDIS